MAQKEFGRRPPPSRLVAAGPAPEAGRAGTFPVVPIAIAGVAVIAVIGLFFVFSGRSTTGSKMAAQNDCRGQAGCRYDVELSCGSAEEPRSVSILAADQDAAEAKARRYNRDCRVRGAVAATSLVKSVATTAVGGTPAEAAPSRTAAQRVPRAARVHSTWRKRR